MGDILLGKTVGICGQDYAPGGEYAGIIAAEPAVVISIFPANAFLKR